MTTSKSGAPPDAAAWCGLQDPVAVICRDDHVYVVTVHGWGHHAFLRFAADGMPLARYDVSAPETGQSNSAYKWLVDPESVREQENQLVYAVDGWRTEQSDTASRDPVDVHGRKQVWRIPL